MIEALADLESSALASLSSIQDASGLEAWRVEHLGSQGALKSVMGMMKDVSKDQKPLAGQRAQEVKQRLEGAFQERKANLNRQALRPLFGSHRTRSATWSRTPPSYFHHGGCDLGRLRPHGL